MYRISLSTNFVTKKWKVISTLIEVSSETDDRYTLTGEEEDMPRSSVVYKTDEDDVMSCGYFVIDMPGYVSLDAGEGFGIIYSLDEEKGKEILIKALIDLCNRKIEFFNDHISKLKEIDTKGKE